MKQIPTGQGDATGQRSTNRMDESQEDTSLVSMGGTTRLLQDSYNSGNSGFKGNSLPILQQQMQKAYKSPQINVDSG